MNSSTFLLRDFKPISRYAPAKLGFMNVPDGCTCKDVVWSITNVHFLMGDISLREELEKELKELRG
jgi:hypothetical protein